MRKFKRAAEGLPMRGPLPRLLSLLCFAAGGGAVGWLVSPPIEPGSGFGIFWGALFGAALGFVLYEVATIS